MKKTLSLLAACAMLFACAVPLSAESSGTLKVSGEIKYADGSAVSWAEITGDDGTNKTSTTAAYGLYELRMLPGFTGTIQPKLDGYTFEPPYYTINSLSKAAVCNFTAIPVNHAGMATLNVKVVGNGRLRVQYDNFDKTYENGASVAVPKGRDILLTGIPDKGSSVESIYGVAGNTATTSRFPVTLPVGQSSSVSVTVSFTASSAAAPADSSTNSGSITLGGRDHSNRAPAKKRASIKVKTREEKMIKVSALASDKDGDQLRVVSAWTTDPSIATVTVGRNNDVVRIRGVSLGSTTMEYEVTDGYESVIFSVTINVKEEGSGIRSEPEPYDSLFE